MMERKAHTAAASRCRRFDSISVATSRAGFARWPVLGCALLVSLTLWLGLRAAPAAAEPKGSDEATTQIRVTGEATVLVKPDRAMLDIALVSEAPAANDAVSRNASLADEVMRALRRVVDAKDEVSSSNYSLSPRYAYAKGGARTLEGYTVRSALHIVVDDVTQVGRIIDVASKAGAGEVQRVQFTLSDDSAPRARALREATLAAKVKAEAMAAAIDMRVLKVVALDEGGVAAQPVRREMARLQSTAAAAPTKLEVGDVSVVARVRMEVEAGR